MGQDIKRMDLEDFRKLGLLQEVNRQFFHPLGLALEMTVYDNECGHVFSNRQQQVCSAPRESIWHDVDSNVGEIRNAAHPFELRKPTFGGVWDYREDAFGMEFGDGMIEEVKIVLVRGLLEHKKAARVMRWGSVIQPPPR